MLSELSFLQWHLATTCVFIRGGLSLGPHYENERIIFSEGLIRAYELQALDPYPRVLIDPSLVQRAKRRPLRGDEDLLAHIIKAQDGIFFVDYLQGLAEFAFFTGNLDELLAVHKAAILSQVQANRSHPAVMAKYQWAAGYHNFRLTELYDSEDWVEGYYEELQERLRIEPGAFPSFERISGESSDSA